MMERNLWNLKSEEKESGLQQGPGDLRLKECLKKCAEMIFEPGNTLEVANKCREKCEYEDNERNCYNKNTESLLVAEEIHSQDLMYF